VELVPVVLHHNYIDLHCGFVPNMVFPLPALARRSPLARVVELFFNIPLPYSCASATYRWADLLSIQDSCRLSSRRLEGLYCRCRKN